MLRARSVLKTQAIHHRKKKILSKSQKGVTSDNGGLLRKVQGEERNEECYGDDHEERQARHHGHLLYMWDEDVQDRQGVVGISARLGQRSFPKARPK
jgi:hypothetical protein